MINIDLSKEKAFSIDFVKESSKIAKSHFLEGMEREWKEDETPVTKTDKFINARLIELVKKNFPDDGVLAEEISHEVETSTRLWVCDPIDGTRPFSHGIPTFGISLALAINGEVILSVIADPILDRVLVSEKGKGCFIEDSPCQVEASTDLRRQIIAVEGVTRIEDKFGKQLGLAFELRKKGAQIITPKSIVYCGLLVALGKIGGVIFFLTNPWDSAGLSLAVTEAGGIVTDLEGNAPLFDRPTKGLIASSSHFHPILLESVKNYVQYLN